ncbi:hypothetical protein BN59_03099 [Legionella massiliensis]|uniref:Uncharacterized protein n=1 Tax=Legionella massiliensis TaxID=1034943 RepID=A0A078KWE1_9GAMM|nr:hypothetical protein [Legionella massiliensis]CDZ78785.1 hypothetical protein BN59_03099 [Legionella massiliensis]CEE14523.1 hypothetical protein BN1094_03099 [Legionella massiliensis]
MLTGCVIVKRHVERRETSPEFSTVLIPEIPHYVRDDGGFVRDGGGFVRDGGGFVRDGGALSMFAPKGRDAQDDELH